MIEVVNKKTHNPTPDDFYIGRGSIMGNPYYFKESNHPQALYKVDTVDECLDNYRKYLGQCWVTNKEIKNFIENLVERELSGDDTNLVCYCFPNKCHGDIIKEVVNDMVFIKRFCDKNKEL